MGDVGAGEQIRRLRSAAGALGIQSGYWDVGGTWHDADDEAVVAVAGPLVGRPGAGVAEVLAAAEAQLEDRLGRTVPPVLVVWGDDPLVVPLQVPADVGRIEVRLVLEGGEEVLAVGLELARDALTVGMDRGRRAWRIDLGERVAAALDGRPLPVGRHRLEVVAGATPSTSVVLAAPRRVVGLGADERLWGVVAPLHALWSRSRPEPHLGHLARLSEWVDGLGGKVVGTLPLLATFLDRPCDPSPYQPVSRRWWNELYLDLPSRPELRSCEPARRALEAAPPVPGPAPFDAPARARAVRQVVGLLAEHVHEAGGHLAEDLRAFVEAEPEVLAYARFRAMVERTGTGWHAWPAEARAGALPVGDADADVRAHVYAQWALRRQLDLLGDRLDARGQRLYLDLPVGSHGDGFDTWVDQDLFGWGASAGAPPDEFFTGGQSWGFPPLRPEASRADGHAQLAACLAAHMRVAGMLRLDHVMGLHRMFWVPDGAGPTAGVYVRYPEDELFAVVAIESHRSGCAVVGEDLGTVPDEVEQAMAEHGLHGMYVAEFAQPGWPGAELGLPGPGAVASVDTHDTPTFAGWVRGDDVDRRWGMGLLDVVGADREREGRSQQVDNLRGFLRARGRVGDDAEGAADSPAATVALHAGLLRELGDTDAACVLVSLDDLEAEVEPQNVPGTPADRPNWVHRLDRPLGEVEADPDLAAVLRSLQEARLRSWSRSLD